MGRGTLPPSGGCSFSATTPDYPVRGPIPSRRHGASCTRSTTRCASGSSAIEYSRGWADVAIAMAIYAGTEQPACLARSLRVLAQ